MRNPLMWKLLRKHISKAQLIGFAIANMVGLTIVLLGLQFWQDVRPVFEDEDSFIRKDYLVVTKSIGTASIPTFGPLRANCALWPIMLIGRFTSCIRTLPDIRLIISVLPINCRCSMILLPNG